MVFQVCDIYDVTTGEHVRLRQWFWELVSSFFLLCYSRRVSEMASRGPGYSTSWQPSAPAMAYPEAFQTAVPEEEFRSRTPPPSYDVAMGHPAFGQGQQPTMQGQLPSGPQYNPNWVRLTFFRLFTVMQ